MTPAAAGAPAPSPEGRVFPPGFLWGAATAAHQVEGGNRWNDWWAAELAGAVPFASGEACRHWDLYPADFDLAAGLGHNAHRFSVEWSRIEPRAGEWDADAIAHYRDVVHALRERDLEPIVTLHHFTNPAWIARNGGWTSRRTPGLFARFVERVRDALGAGVRYWITINEPTVYAQNGYITGSWPPNLRGAWAGAMRTLRHMARAHALAYRVLHARGGAPRVGYAHSAPWIVPCDPGKRGDRYTARLRDLALNGLFPWLIGARHRAGAAGHGGGRPAPLDFLGINYYARTIVRRGRRGPPRWLGERCPDEHHADRGPRSDLGWEVFPEGLQRVLERFARLGVPLMVTENGIATGDETLRAAYVASHVQALGRAVARGIPVLGYLYWTLMDNFEWAEGTTARFGLAEVDFRTQTRTPRPAARALAAVCRSGAPASAGETWSARAPGGPAA